MLTLRGFLLAGKEGRIVPCVHAIRPYGYSFPYNNNQLRDWYYVAVVQGKVANPNFSDVQIMELVNYALQFVHD